MTSPSAPGLLLAIDGDSLAHRAYHALPKTIRSTGGRPANALVGFANFLLTLWDAERPAAVLAGFDSLESPTYRNEALPGYQSGRVFEDAIVEQLALLPELVESFGFAIAKAPGLRGRRLPRGGRGSVERAGGGRDLGSRRLSARRASA